MEKQQQQQKKTGTPQLFGGWPLLSAGVSIYACLKRRPPVCQFTFPSNPAKLGWVGMFSKQEFDTLIKVLKLQLKWCQKTNWDILNIWRVYLSNFQSAGQQPNERWLETPHDRSWGRRVYAERAEAKQGHYLMGCGVCLRQQRLLLAVGDWLFLGLNF